MSFWSFIHPKCFHHCLIFNSNRILCRAETTYSGEYCWRKEPKGNFPNHCISYRKVIDLYLTVYSQQLYIMDDQECSELCSCGSETLALSCHALCVPLVPCRTSLAYYSHAAPAYQAFRGRCLCYSGRFICMRPPPGEYKVASSHRKCENFFIHALNF